MNNLFDHSLDLHADVPIRAGTLPTHGGVYLLTDDSEQPILLAVGENLRRVVTHRLSAPPPDEKSRRANLGEIARRLWWRPTYSRFETTLAHWRIARGLYPKTYRKLIGFGPSWFLRVDLLAAIPQFTAVKEFRPNDACYVGPFAMRKHVGEWIQMLEDAFDLCRYHHILEQAPDGKPCAYFEMGKCPAPCNDSISMDVYKKMMSDALAFTLSSESQRIAGLQDAMRSAAAELAFEKAASLRHTLDRATALIDRPHFRHLADVACRRWLVVQRAGPPRRAPSKTLVRPYFVHCGIVDAGETITLTDVSADAGRWFEQCMQPSESSAEPPLDPTARSEGIWLLAKFLFREDRAPGLFFRSDQLPSAEGLADAVHRRFSPRQPAADCYS